jgi:hypothetical protein
MLKQMICHYTPYRAHSGAVNLSSLCPNINKMNALFSRMISKRGKMVEHIRLWSILILFASIVVATSSATPVIVQPDIIAPGDILPVSVTGVPGNITVVNIPFLDVIMRNFFIEPIIQNIPLLSPSGISVPDPNDIIPGTIPFPFP